MKLKRTLTQLTSSILITLSSVHIAYSDTVYDLVNIINNQTPLEKLIFFERKINEWSIGVFNPDYVPSFPSENYLNPKPNYEFNQLVTFGDSLSDKGTHTRSTMFLAGGYYFKLYNDYLSEYYTGKSSIPHTYGGVNYAESGATFKNKGDHLNIRNQIDTYLNHFGGKADPENIYILNAGAMDINKSMDNIILNLINGSYHFDDEFYTIDNAPQVAAEDIVYLRSKGAKYIIVGNIPDASLTPYTPMMPVEIISSILDKLYLPNFGIITHIGKLIDKRLRNPANQIQGTGKEVIRANGIQTLQSILWFIPNPLVINIYDFLVTLQRIPTQQFNKSFDLELEKIGGDMVYFDYRKLIQEIVDDYQSFGFDDIIIPTCDLGFSSRYCDYDSDRYHKDRIYLFGDWFHPSPEAHFLTFQYIQSIFDAPLYVTSISEHFSNIYSAKNSFLENQLLNIKQITNRELNRWSLIAGYSGLLNNKNYRIHQLDSKKTFINTFNIGAYTFVSPELTLGFLSTTSLGKQKPFDSFNYHYFSENISLFSGWNHPKGFWLNSILDFGVMRITNIQRSIQLGKKRRTEKASSTHAYSFGGHLKGGFDWIDKENIQSGPQIGLNISRVNVRNYKENGNRSTSMHFESHNKNNFYATIGWYINSKNYQIGNTPTQFKIEVNFAHTFGHEKNQIRGAINSTLTSFTRELTHSKKWTEMKTNANFQISQTSYIQTNIGFLTDNQHNRKLNYSLGYSHKF